MQQDRHSNIRQSIVRYHSQLGYGIGLLLAIWLAVATMIQLDYKQAVEEIEHNNDQLVRAFEAHVRSSFLAVDQQLLLVRAEYERAGVTPAVRTILDQTRQSPLLAQVLLLDAEGKIVQSVIPGAPGQSFAFRSYFIAHVAENQRKTFISEPIVGLLTKKSAMYFSQRVNHPDGQFAGVVVMALDQDYFHQFYRTMNFKPGQFVRLIGRDGIVRLSWDTDDSMVGRNVSGNELFSQQLPARSCGSFMPFSAVTGVLRYVSYRAMSDYPMVVVAGIDVEPALAEYRERRERYLLGAGLASLMILLFMGWAIRSAAKKRGEDERWKLVVDGVADGIWDWDAATGKRYYSERYRRIVGYDEEDEFSRHWQDWQQRVHPDDLPRVDKARSLLIQNPAATFNETFRLLCRNGDFRWVRSRAAAICDQSGAIIRVVGTLTDIHAEKQADEMVRQSERQLRESEAKYKALIDQAFEAVALIEPDSGQIVEVNQRFSEWFGYRLPEDAPLSREAIVVDGPEVQAAHDAVLFVAGVLPVARRTFRHKNGSLLFMERGAKLITHQSKTLIMVTYRNIAEQLQQEQARLQDAAIARQIQQAQLRSPQDSEYVAFKSAIYSSGEISGDLYHLEWRNEGQLLRGYLVDVTGNGLTTALYTSTITVLMHEVAELDASLPEQVQWLNRQISGRFASGAFAAAIAFELDLQMREIRYVGAGITRFWIQTGKVNGKILTPGLYLGIDPEQVYLMQSLPISAGDQICFATDGLEKAVAGTAAGTFATCDQVCGFSEVLAKLSNLFDDATLLCIRVKGLPAMLLADVWPKTLRLNGFEDYRRLKLEIANVLAEVTGKTHSIQEVAVNEAIANALECRDGKARSHQARVRFNLFGNRLVVRVKTSRIGFAGNALLRRLKAHPETMFEFGEDAGMGRGIPIMLSTTDRMLYNSEGTELLLVWKIRKSVLPGEKER